MEVKGVAVNFRSSAYIINSVRNKARPAGKRRAPRTAAEIQHGKKCCAFGNSRAAPESGLRHFLASLVNESSTEAKLIMTRIPKVLLAVSLTAFALGIVAVFGNPEIPVGWTVAMPLGAVSFGLFLVTFLLQQEVARFDEEERARLDLADRHAARLADDAAIAVSTTATHLSPAHV